MFRKPKKKVRNKRKTFEDDTDEVGEGENSTSELIEEARKASTTTSIGGNNSKRVKKPKQDNGVMHQYEAAASKGRVSEKDLATRQAEHHPEEKSNKTDQETKSNGPASRGDDGIFRNKTRNKFHAGPIKSSTFVRTTCRFDYQPDICKDYKDTGFCGFGDTCIYLHDRGDTMTGWQLEQQWEEQRKKEQTDKELKAFADGKEFDNENDQNNAAVQPGDDGLPFACFLCRQPFTNPVVTSCNHYFCEKCIMDHVRQDAKNACPICNKDTHGVFNRPIKLITKKRRLVGSSASWQEFAEASKNKTTSTTNED